MCFPSELRKALAVCVIKNAKHHCSSPRYTEHCAPKAAKNAGPEPVQRRPGAGPAAARAGAQRWRNGKGEKSSAERKAM